jgi:hypothetical protein
MATMAVTKLGYSEMAVTACFASPLFILQVGLPLSLMPNTISE